MKMITAIVKPSVCDQLTDALSVAGVTGLTVTEVRGYGRQKGQTEVYRGAEYQVTLIPKLRFDIAVEAGNVSRLVDVIKDAAKTGKIGDGKIFVTDLEQAMRIRTGETGSDAVNI